ncbi:hypothetical protein CHS0354_036347 [Potamilus streckersoni]|uniref:Uncharacterized protein n=1 Tax=Potamilus streckersoni TaxID=2493646 RepID=A0AAE0SEE7_9BIVA|nr:hypothetical protein CHS0354_036347 [Potamilus streckersoni]
MLETEMAGSRERQEREREKEREKRRRLELEIIQTRGGSHKNTPTPFHLDFTACGCRGRKYSNAISESMAVPLRRKEVGADTICANQEAALQYVEDQREVIAATRKDYNLTKASKAL